MKILALRGENLASIQQKFTIDFVNGALANNGLFAITGKTGAGKSTLLDAICLALYDKMPRLSNKGLDAEIGLNDETKIKANDVRSILSRGKAQCFAEVDFLAIDGTEWRAHWSVRRARGKAEGRIQTADQWLENLSTQQRFAGKKTETLNEIERLVGLSYEQFRRAVMLPQGDFAAFLKANENDKAVLLERMTGGEIYARLSIAAFEKAKFKKAQLAKLVDQLNDKDILSNEEKASLTLALASAKEQKESAIKQDKSLRAYQASLQEQKTLMNGLDITKAELEVANAALTSAVSQREMLSLVEKVQPAREDFAQCNDIALLLTKLDARAKKEAQELGELEASIAIATGALLSEKEKGKQKETEWNNAEPNLRKAAEKDVEIEGFANQLKALEQTLFERENKISEQQSGLMQAKQQSQALTQKQTELTASLQQKSALMVIVEQFSYLQDNVEQYAKLNQSIALRQTKLAELEKNRPLLADNIQQGQQELKEIEEKLNHLAQWVQQNKITEKEALQRKLQNESKEWQERQNDLTKLKEMAALWLRGIEEKEQCLLKQKELTLELNRSLEQSEKNKLNLTVNESKLKEAELALEQSQAVASLSDHRNLLQKNTPCPLCGSLEHPYTKEHVVEGIIEAQKKRVQGLQKEQQSLMSSHAIAVQTQKSLSQEQRQQVKKLNQLEEQFDAQKARFSSALLASEQKPHEVLALKSTELFDWLNTLTEKMVANDHRLELLSSALEAQNQALKEAYNKEASLAKLKTQYSEQKSKIQQSESEKNTLTQSISFYLAEQEKDQEQCLSKKEALNKLYGNESWLEKYKAKGKEAYLAELACEASQIKAIQSELQETAENLRQTELKIASEQSMLEAAKASLQEETNSAILLKNRLKAQQQERKQIFDYADLHRYEKNSKEAIAQAIQAQEAAEQHLRLVTDKLIEKKTAIQECNAQQKQAQVEQQERKQKWQAWLLHFALTESELVHLLSFDSQWQKAQRESLQLLDKEKERFETLLQERQKQLDDKQTLFIQAQEWLLANQAETEEKSQALTARLAEQAKQQEEHIYQYRTRLDASDKAALEQSKLLEEIAQQKQNAELWLKMGDFIGSADGKKFRNMAQALTLNQLVLGANQHLQELASRYSLQSVPSSPLALQVVDHDMGDEVRSVESLSGGESFLVSLSLALALASLAASSRKLGSLFIDEGFGTLDPDSLEMTLACLDALQAKGRQIGVISHVTTLVERIGSQVVVETQGGGVSRVKICG